MIITIVSPYCSLRLLDNRRAVNTEGGVMIYGVRGVPKGASRTHSAWQTSPWAHLVTCKALFARAPVLGLCFFVCMSGSNFD